MATAQQAWDVFNNADLLFDEAQIAAAIDTMAASITHDLADKNPLVICVMNGGLILTSEITQRLRFPLQMDYLQATRYQGDVRGIDQVEWLARPGHSLNGRHVLIIDDILDEGLTLIEIQNYCHTQGAASVHTAVLLKKRHERCHEQARADYTGLEVGDRYVFGFGMDYKHFLRNLPAIYAVRES
jgi:hypoxanthine phosphoribosyltransferase